MASLIRRRGMAWRSIEVHGGYRAAETAVIVWNGRDPLDAHPPVLYIHGFGGSEDTNRTAACLSMLAGIIDDGHPILIGDYGGGNGWGQDDITGASGAIDDYLSWASSTFGIRTDQLVMAGESAGTLSAQIWAWNHRVQVAAMFGVVPIPGLADFYDANVAFQGAIDSAYTDHAGYLAALPTHDPEANRSRLIGIPTRFEAQISDELITPESIGVHAAAIGAEVHYHPGAHADVYTAVDQQGLRLWLDGVLN